MSLIDEIQIDLDREDYFHPDSKISRIFSPRFKDFETIFTQIQRFQFKDWIENNSFKKYLPIANRETGQ